MPQNASAWSVLLLGISSAVEDLLHIGDMCGTLWGVTLQSEWRGMGWAGPMEAAPSIPGEGEISQVWTQLWARTSLDTAGARSPASHTTG